MYRTTNCARTGGISHVSKKNTRISVNGSVGSFRSVCTGPEYSTLSNDSDYSAALSTVPTSTNMPASNMSAGNDNMPTGNTTMPTAADLRTCM